MKIMLRSALTTAAVAALLGPGVALAGGSMTRADFERCNAQAMQRAGVADTQSPAASPSTSGSLGSGTGGHSSTSTPSVGGGAGGGTGSTGSSADATTSMGSTSTGSGTHSGAAGAAAGGGDEQKLDRAVQAYRDCLQK